MPFGFTNTPAVFQALMNDIVGDFLNVLIFVYLDNTLIYWDHEHQLHVRKVVQCLLENQLHVKAEKCEFHSETVYFLGYVFESEQVRTDPEKVKAVMDWPTPTTQKQLQCFLGFAYFYHRFIRNYSKIAIPLT